MRQRRRGGTGRGSDEPGTGRRWGARSRASALTAGLLCLAGGSAAAIGAVGARSDTRDAQAAADAAEIVSIRFDLRAAHMAEANTLLLEVFVQATDADIDAARAARREARADAAAALERIADGQGPTALEARSLLEMLESDGIGELEDAPPLTLLDTAWNAAFLSRQPEAALGDDLLALDDLMLTGTTGAAVLSDGLDAAYVLGTPDVDELLVDYVAESEPYLENNGGHLGPDAADPLADSYVFDARGPVEHPGVDRIRRLVVESELWTFDQWIRSWQQGRPTDPAPFELPELVTRTNDLTVASTAVIDEAIAAEREALTDTASSAAARGLVLFGLAAMLLLVPLLLGGSAVRRRFRAITSAAAQIAIDPLTGVGNRNHLRAETETKVSDDAHRWHLAAAIDMDRFKLINDTWGHAVGDRVLVEVAQRLTVIVDEWRGSVPGASGTVVRLGGDEFLLTLHAPAPIDIDAVRRRLDEVRSTWISVSARDDTKPGVARPTDRVQLAFSVGLATALAPVALDDLMHLADLASYEEKAVRSGADPRRRRPDDTGTTEHQTSEHGAADRTSTSAAGDDV